MRRLTGKTPQFVLRSAHHERAFRNPPQPQFRRTAGIIVQIRQRIRISHGIAFRIRAVRQIDDHVKGLVGIRIRDRRIKILFVFRQIADAILIRIHRRIRRIQRIQAVSRFPAVRHAVAVRVGIDGIGPLFIFLQIRQAVAIRIVLAMEILSIKILPHPLRRYAGHGALRLVDEISTAGHELGKTAMDFQWTPPAILPLPCGQNFAQHDVLFTTDADQMPAFSFRYPADHDAGSLVIEADLLLVAAINPQRRSGRQRQRRANVRHGLPIQLERIQRRERRFIALLQPIALRGDQIPAGQKVDSVLRGIGFSLRLASCRLRECRLYGRRARQQGILNFRIRQDRVYPQQKPSQNDVEQYQPVPTHNHRISCFSLFY